MNVVSGPSWWVPRGPEFALYAIAVTVLPADLVGGAAVEHAAVWDQAAPGEVVTLCGVFGYLFPAGGDRGSVAGAVAA